MVQNSQGETAVGEFDDYKKEILDQIGQEYQEFEGAAIGEFNRILGGADTTIYGFDILSEKKRIPLILRIYRPQYSSSASREFEVMLKLYKAGISVPKPYIINEESEVAGSSYIIMERIEGRNLSEALLESQGTPRFHVLLESFAKNLVEINQLDWKKDFGFLSGYYIEENHHLFVSHQLSHPKRIIDEHDIEMLVPVINWLEENQPVMGEPCLLHSDYHAMNVLVRDDDSLVTIDWANVKLGDYRYDLGFAVLVLNSMIPGLSNEILDAYQRISGKQVDNLEYFTVLSSIWNLLRVYSGVFDYSVTGENEETARLLASDFYDYAAAIVMTTQETTGISLQELLNGLKNYKQSS